MEQAAEHGHVVPYGTFIRVWVVLLTLTTLLVYISLAYGKTMAVWGMLTITPLKAGLVFFYFMHLKYEKPFLKSLLLIVLLVLIIFIGLTFQDISTR
jgi:cytochrome c oxidase subunit 4